MLNKIIAAILTIGCMLDFEKREGEDLRMKHVFEHLEYRSELWVQCYKAMLKYMRIR